jgi:hypothetical protein
MTIKEEFLTPKQVFETFGRPFFVWWLERRRRLGGGPRFLKVGTGGKDGVYYQRADIEAWIGDHTKSGSEARCENSE